MSKKKTTDEEKLPGFEESLAELEKTVRDLEQGQIGLEESLARYESGVKLLRHCYGLLTTAQGRIEQLSGVDADGNPVTQPMEADADDSLEEKAQRRSRRRTAQKRRPEPSSLGEDEAPAAGGDDMDESGRLF